MSATRYAISWIYGEFIIARMQRGFPLQRWAAPYIVNDLSTLSQAMADAGREVDLSRGGDLAIAYEDDLHTHEFFDVPQMAKKELESLLSRKVENNKPFEEQAAWCYHEARHEDDEGILLHILPQNIVNSTIRICQEFYLTPKRLVPLTEIISELIQTYHHQKSDVLIAVALFSSRTEIVITLGSGEVLFVRELPYDGYNEHTARLTTDINRTIQYAKQKFGCVVKATWLLGQKTDVIQSKIVNDIESEVHYDPNSLDPTFWAMGVSNLTGQISANFIPLLARKKINKTLLHRAALWMLGIVFIASVSIASFVEYTIAKQAFDEDTVKFEITKIKEEMDQLDSLLGQFKQEKKQLSLLQADSKNLPAFFINHLSHLIDEQLVLTKTSVERTGSYWKIELVGNSDLPLSEIAPILISTEKKLSSSPWNMTITNSWSESWYQQLKTGAAASNSKIGFSITGLIQ